ncbi:hypothetical protein Mapa_008133 [Marchantia paleacea]|nr:hypothetical protein Mapa_008133 [Marchantia paleacea]
MSRCIQAVTMPNAGRAMTGRGGRVDSTWVIEYLRHFLELLLSFRHLFYRAECCSPSFSRTCKRIKFISWNWLKHNPN